MFQTFAQAREFVDAHGVQMVDLKFCDLWGRWHHVTLSASEFTPDLMAAGVGFDGSFQAQCPETTVDHHPTIAIVEQILGGPVERSEDASHLS